MLEIRTRIMIKNMVLPNANFLDNKDSDVENEIVIDISDPSK